MDPQEKERLAIQLEMNDAAEMLEPTMPNLAAQIDRWVLRLRDLHKAAPVPSPSADARAKLEDIALYGDIHKAPIPDDLLPAWEKARANKDEEAETRIMFAAFFRALPPHEGETPQPEAVEALATEIHAELGNYNAARGSEVSPPFIERIKPILARALAHRAAPPETPQPAAESGWRDNLEWVIEDIEASLRELRVHETHRPQFVGSRDLEQWLEKLRSIPLPPVVQTREEERRD